MAAHKRNEKGVIFYMKPEELAKLKFRAKLAGQTLSGYVKELARRDDPAGKAAYDSREAAMKGHYAELVRVNNNLASLGNLQKIRGGNMALYKEIQSVLASMRKLIALMGEAMKR